MALESYRDDRLAKFQFAKPTLLSEWLDQSFLWNVGFVSGLCSSGLLGVDLIPALDDNHINNEMITGDTCFTPCGSRMA